MKNDIADILFKYTTGEATLEETNDALKEAEAGFNLEPSRNEITPDEMALTTVGDTPEEANGFGLLDTGTGSMEKVHVTNGKLDEAINQVNHDGTTNTLGWLVSTYAFSAAALACPIFLCYAFRKKAFITTQGIAAGMIGGIVGCAFAMILKTAINYAAIGIAVSFVLMLIVSAATKKDAVPPEEINKMME